MKINLHFTIILMFSSLKYLLLVYHVKWDILIVKTLIQHDENLDINKPTKVSHGDC